MPQKQKVSAEEKVKVIEDYINNRISLSEAARRGGVARDTISQWARNYELKYFFLPAVVGLNACPVLAAPPFYRQPTLTAVRYLLTPLKKPLPLT